MRRISIIMAVVLAAVLAACGTEEDSAPTRQPDGFGAPAETPTAVAATSTAPAATATPEPLTAQQIVDRARAALETVTSFRISLTQTITWGGMPDEDFVSETSWAAPDRFHSVMSGRRGEPDSEVIVVGDRMFTLTETGTRGRAIWVEDSPPPEEMTPSPYDLYMLFILFDLEDVTLAGTEVINGEAVYKLEGKRPQPEPGDPEYVEPEGLVLRDQTSVFVSQDDFRIVRMEQVTESVWGTLPEPIDPEELRRYTIGGTLTQEFRDYNEPVTIEPPAEYMSRLEAEAAFGGNLGLMPEPDPAEEQERNVAMLRAWIDWLPEHEKMLIGDDVAVHMPCPPRDAEGWQEPSAIYHLPSASFVELSNGSVAPNELYQSDEGKARLEAVTADEALMAHINERAKDSDRCPASAG